MLAAAIAIHADTICTNNLRDFPAPTLAQFDLTAISADQLLLNLFQEFPQVMAQVHRRAVRVLRGASDSSTVEALRKAGAPLTAEKLRAWVRTNEASDKGSGT